MTERKYKICCVMDKDFYATWMAVHVKRSQ